MSYLLDADVLISAKRNHYRMGICPGFCTWILQAHVSGTVFSIKKVQKELKNMKDALATWAVQNDAFFLPADSDVAASLAVVSNWTNAQHYKQEAVSDFFNAADYWLVGHALAKGFTVVTHEVPDPQSKRRVKIPDACSGIGVAWTNPFEMLEQEGARFVL
jgi:predicted nucleic acid-binding protein